MEESAFLGFVIVAILGAVYFFPVLLARSRQHPKTGMICVVTVLLGWTLIGWAVALLWAMKRTDNTEG